MLILILIIMLNREQAKQILFALSTCSNPTLTKLNIGGNDLSGKFYLQFTHPIRPNPTQLTTIIITIYVITIHVIINKNSIRRRSGGVIDGVDQSDQSVTGWHIPDQ